MLGKSEFGTFVLSDLLQLRLDGDTDHTRPERGWNRVGIIFRSASLVGSTIPDDQAWGELRASRLGFCWGTSDFHPDFWESFFEMVAQYARYAAIIFDNQYTRFTVGQSTTP